VNAPGPDASQEQMAAWCRYWRSREYGAHAEPEPEPSYIAGVSVSGLSESHYRILLRMVSVISAARTTTEIEIPA
jgi:hypothetical protein